MDLGIELILRMISPRKKMRHKGEQRVRYNLKRKGAFDILNDISENFILVQLMESLVNVYHVIIIVGY